MHILSPRVIRHCIMESEPHIFSKLLGVPVLPTAEVPPYRAKIHRVFDNRKIVMQAKCNWIDRLVEYPSKLVLHQPAQKRRRLLECMRI
uniref:Uncharacterized protein n=1 Tax=Arundo donax TaxID=35708 RepID=A0A0A9DY08_ARUDO